MLKKVPDKSIEINGGNVVYEILGKTGRLHCTDARRPIQQGHPGPKASGRRAGQGRLPGAAVGSAQLRQVRRAVLRAERIPHARRNTAQLITGLDIGPCIIAGGSGGARDSMLTTMLYPEMVTKLVVWNIVGGVYGSFVLGGHYIVPSILAVRGTGIKACCTSPSGRSASSRTRPTRQRLLDLDADEFLKVMLRWLNAFVSKPGQTIPGVDGRDVRQHQGSHADHPRRRERLGPPQAHLARGQLPDQGIRVDRPAVAGGRLGAGGREVRASGKVKLQHVRHLGAGRARDPGFPGRLMVTAHDGEDLDLAVQRRLQRGVDPAFRNPLQVGFAQRHLHDVPALVAGPAVRSLRSARSPASTPCASSSVPLLT